MRGVAAEPLGELLRSLGEALLCGMGGDSQASRERSVAEALGARQDDLALAARKAIDHAHELLQARDQGLRGAELLLRRRAARILGLPGAVLVGLVEGEAGAAARLAATDRRCAVTHGADEPGTFEARQRPASLPLGREEIDDDALQHVVRFVAASRQEAADQGQEHPFLIDHELETRIERNARRADGGTRRRLRGIAPVGCVRTGKIERLHRFLSQAPPAPASLRPPDVGWFTRIAGGESRPLEETWVGRGAVSRTAGLFAVRRAFGPRLLKSDSCTDLRRNFEKKVPPARFRRFLSGQRIQPDLEHVVVSCRADG